MSRSKWKGPFLSNSVLKLSLKYISRKNRIRSRSSVIPSSLIGKYVSIYNGKEFKQLYISKEKIGLKFGEFSFTRKKKSLKKKKKKSK